MKVIAKTTLYRNIGQATQKEVFSKGKSYNYLERESTWENHIVQPDEGLDSTFNEKEFAMYFNQE